MTNQPVIWGIVYYNWCHLRVSFVLVVMGLGQSLGPQVQPQSLSSSLFLSPSFVLQVSEYSMSYVIVDRVGEHLMTPVLFLAARATMKLVGRPILY